MRRISIALALGAAMLALNGCAVGRALTSPGSIAGVAQHTAADEEARKRCEETYKLTRTVMEIGVDAGLIKGARATQVAGLDNELYGALNVCRTAYRLFNSAATSQAADDLDKQADAFSATVKGGND